MQQLIILLISSVVGKVECLRETEKRSVTPSSLWNNKRVKEIHCEKFISRPDLMIKISFSENKKNIYFFPYFSSRCTQGRMCVCGHTLMRTTTLYQYSTFKNNSYRSFTHFQRFMAVSNFPISFRLFCRHQKFIFRKLCLVQLTYSLSVPALLLKLISLFFQQTLGKTLWVGHLNEEKI